MSEYKQSNIVKSAINLINCAAAALYSIYSKY